MTLKEYLIHRLAESKKNQYAFTDEQAAYVEGREAELESLLEAINDGTLNGFAEVNNENTQ